MMINGWNGMGSVFGWVFLLLILAGIAVLVVLAVRLALGGDRGADRATDARGGRARAILDERYARGEIDSTEYDERVARLRDGR